MALWQALPVQEQAIGGFRGLFEAISPSDRPLGVLSACSNLVIDPTPALSIRPGLTKVGPSVGVSPIRGIHAYYDTANSFFDLLAQSGTDVYRYVPATPGWALLGVMADAPFTAANIATGSGTLAVIFNGTSARKYDGTNLQTLLGTPPQGKYVVSAYNLLFVAGMSNRPADVDNCDDGLPESWTPGPGSNAASFTLGISDDDTVQWLGFDPVQGKVVAWLRYSLWVLTGPETPNRPALWQWQTAAKVGTPNGRTVQIINGIWMWLTDRGFARWAGGDVDVVLDPVRESFNLIDWSAIDGAVASQDEEHRYWWKVPKTGGGHIYFCYDPRYDAWFTGSGKDLVASGSFRFDEKETPLVGDSAGNVYKVEGDDDDGTPISWEAVIGPSVLGAPFYKKELTHLIVAMSLGTGATATASLAGTETGAFAVSRTLTPGSDYEQVELPAPFLASNAARNAVLRLKLAGTGQATIHDAALRYIVSGR